MHSKMLRPAVSIRKQAALWSSVFTLAAMMTTTPAFAADALNVSGTYTQVSADNYDEYLKAIGAGLQQRQAEKIAIPTVKIEVSDDKWTITTTTSFKTTKVSFRIGEAFESTAPNGESVKSIATIDGNNLVEQQTSPNFTATITRIFSDPQKMEETLQTKAVVATRAYEKK